MTEIEARLPTTLDLLVSNKCQMECVCFAPDKKDFLNLLNAEKWKEIIKNGKDNGIRKIVFTGFEPLMSIDFPELARYSKELDMETTLSTNALLFPIKHMEFMQWIDNIGIPIDGSTPEINSRLRHPLGNFQFQTAIESLKIMLNEYPNKGTTVRSIVSKLNINDIQEIPKGLNQRGIDTSKLRWKIYQFDPAVPECYKSKANNMAITTDQFLDLVAKLRLNSGFANFAYLPIAAGETNHLLVYPDGTAMMLEKNGSQTQDEFNLLPDLKYTNIGNLTINFNEVINNWGKIN